MMFSGLGDVATDAHVGYVAGRYRSGVWSDEWTEVSRCAERTFTRYAPACACGWRGPAQPANPHGLLTCQRVWVFEHAPTAPAELELTSPGRGSDGVGQPSSPSISFT